MCSKIWLSLALVMFSLNMEARTILKRTFVSSCPDNCSGDHGKCDNINGTEMCVCEEQWGGVNCSYHNFDLNSDHALSVTISQNEMYYFTIINGNPPKNNLTVLVLGFSREQGVKGPSFYLAHDYYPNRTHYDFMNESIALKKNLTVLKPNPGKWYLAVVGQDPKPLILTIQANLDDIDYTKYRYSKCVCSSDNNCCKEYAKLLSVSNIHNGYVKKGYWDYWYSSNIHAGVFSITVESDHSIPGIHVLNSNYTSVPCARKVDTADNTTCIVNNTYSAIHNDYYVIGVYGIQDNSGPYTIFVQPVGYNIIMKLL